MKETKYFCDICGNEIAPSNANNSVSYNFYEFKTYVSNDLNAYDKHAHTGCIKELGKELKELEELPF